MHCGVIVLRRMHTERLILKIRLMHICMSGANHLARKCVSGEDLACCIDWVARLQGSIREVINRDSRVLVCIVES